MTDKTDVREFIGDLEGGDFEAKLSHALSQAAANAIRHQKGSSVKLTVSLEPMPNGTQVVVAHQIDSDVPTAEGKVRETIKAKTPLYVDAKGKMTFFHPKQTDFLGKKGEVSPGSQD